jgi:hypothetical protein
MMRQPATRRVARYEVQEFPPRLDALWVAIQQHLYRGWGSVIGGTIGRARRPRWRF